MSDRQARERELEIKDEMRKCVYFTGIQHDECKVGMNYMSVRDASVSPARWPCLDPDALTSCPLIKCPSYEEAAKTVDEHRAVVAEFLEKIKTAELKPGCNVIQLDDGNTAIVCQRRSDEEYEAMMMAGPPIPYCDECGEEVSDEEIDDSDKVGSLLRCRACLAKVGMV